MWLGETKLNSLANKQNIVLGKANTAQHPQYVNAIVLVTLRNILV